MIYIVGYLAITLVILFLDVYSRVGDFKEALLALGVSLIIVCGIIAAFILISLYGYGAFDL